MSLRPDGLTSFRDHPTQKPWFSSESKADALCVARQLPFWALVSFGSYLLFKLGWGVLTFNDVPDAHKELLKEIDMAREELRSRGVDMD